MGYPNPDGDYDYQGGQLQCARKADHKAHDHIVIEEAPAPVHKVRRRVWCLGVGAFADDTLTEPPPEPEQSEPEGADYHALMMVAADVLLQCGRRPNALPITHEGLPRVSLVRRAARALNAIAHHDRQADYPSTTNTEGTTEP